uniref:U33-Lycotoxin-Lsp1m_1 n=1 Tax=Lycosa sp. SGP-2016 TaxID=1905177 RepID=A0A482ZEP2_9ARAC
MIRYVLISALLIVAVYSFTIEDENEDTFLEEAKEELDPEEERRIALPPGAVCNGHKSDCQCFGAKYKCSCPWLWRFRRSAKCHCKKGGLDRHQEAILQKQIPVERLKRSCT